MVERRCFLVTVLAATVIAPSRVAAQPRVYRLAMMYPVGAAAKIAEAMLLPELRRLGYVEGQNLQVEQRTGSGRRAEYRDLARSILAFKPDVIFAASGRMAEAVRYVTTTIPIVTITSDPVTMGLAATIRRPGGNVTGVTMDAGLELFGKAVELLKQAVPTVSRVGFLATEQAWRDVWGATMRDAATRAGVASIAATLADPITEPSYRAAFAAMARQRVDGLVVTDHAEGLANRELILNLALEARLPAIYAYRAFAEAGGLMAYAVELEDVLRSVAGYIDRIFKGANPAELPFQQPTKFEFVINTKAAKNLGLTIPPSLLVRADKLIE